MTLKLLTTFSNIHKSIDEPQSFDLISFVSSITCIDCKYSKWRPRYYNFKEGKKVSIVHCNLDVNASCTGKCKQKRQYKDIAPAEETLMVIPPQICDFASRK
jgi:hypothetical protein